MIRDHLSSKLEGKRKQIEEENRGANKPSPGPRAPICLTFSPIVGSPSLVVGSPFSSQELLIPLDGKDTSLASVPPPPQPYLSQSPLCFRVLLPLYIPPAAHPHSLPPRPAATHMPPAPKSPQAKRAGAPKAKGAVRAKSGCYTCRIRRKVRHTPVPSLSPSPLTLPTEVRRTDDRRGELPDLRPPPPPVPRLRGQASRVAAGIYPLHRPCVPLLLTLFKESQIGRAHV